jgi:uncharacterized protein YndB with AHSA1/START domain
MGTTSKTTIAVKTNIQASIEKVWHCWTDPQHVTQWNAATTDWHTPKAENNLLVGDRFVYRMEAKDGSFGFDFGGTYTLIEPFRQIEYTIDDGRKVRIEFQQEGNETHIVEEFEAENQNPVELQQAGWQAILNNFRNYVERQKAIIPLHFEALIDAPISTVYSKMLDQETYAEWTSVFNPSSRYEGSWEKGSKIKFLGVDKQGKQGGMLGVVEENIPNQFVSINYYGIIDEDKEITSGSKMEGWANTYENYRFNSVNGKTLLTVDLGTSHKYQDYFEATYPQALEKLKRICEI